MRRALRDEDWTVAGDAARALGALGKRASPSVGALVNTLSHEDQYVRIYAAEALASIGPDAFKATNALAEALGDPVPGVRWAACEALASIGPAAQSAVPQLIEALEDEFLYVRIFAAGALGSIGPKAQSAREALTAAANDPALRSEAEWALNRIAGIKAGEPAVSHAVPAPSVAPHPPTTNIKTGNPPVDWDTSTGRNIAWSVELGHETFGRPVVAGDAVYVGTDNARHLNPAIQEEAGVLMAIDAKDGTFLWQDVATRVERGLREFLLPSTTSAPYVEGNRLYYVTAECQLRSLDTQGFRDGENDGPYRDEVFEDKAAADMVWELDICGRLGVFPHEATNSDVLPAGDLLMVSTSNGQNEGHTRVPSPRAPSLIAVDKHSGEVVWRAIGSGGQVLHGQWSSPVAANVNGRVQVLFGGGDGWLRSYDAASGHEVWRFDGNPKDARFLPRPRVFSRGSIIASPVFDDGRVFVAMGQSPGHGNGPVIDSCDQSQRPGRRDREQAPLDFPRCRSRGGNAHREGRPAIRWGPGRNDSLPGRGDRRPGLEARDERGDLGKPPAGRRPALRRERCRQHDRAACRTAKAITGADRDGCADLFAAGGDRRCALSGHSEPVIPHREDGNGASE